ncbi:amidohydrolase [Mycobacterium sp. MS1601]|uniref:M20/M25/M40 family metallo-hydrolase n=1 Tax=Mycobacterium sp. MS1601 TaxID=1936029 RepID=UPI00097969DE|nr:M20/M25/M40 family metallo-hydrolase [Mycobacterium sp. MS1601]AQA03839.1 amidohydrolase [Mycobacterium sp. MS1601]
MVDKKLAAILLALVMVLTACSQQAQEPQPVPAAPGTPVEAVEFATSLQQRVTGEAMMNHLRALQDIADAHDGNRAAGTSGYDASVDYVAEALRTAGFEVQTPEFEVRVFRSEPGTITVGDAEYGVRALEYSTGTAASGVTARLVPARAEDSPGCTPQDYDGLDVSGAVVLVDRGHCPFAEKAAVAAERGAVAVVIADNTDARQLGGTLGDGTSVKIPVVSVSKADGARLRARPGDATIRVEAEVQELTSRNVIAQTSTGSTSDVVMVGAHLDSVPEGPGINDNGSGVAAVLETALQLGSSPPVNNAVRFGFWGAEEIGLVGSRKYVESLNGDQLKDIAMYLNFDMVGSPNPGYFTYDGDQSTPFRRDQPPARVPEGSAGIERTLTAYLESAGMPAQDTSFDGRSDYDAFTFAGIPSGGLYSGAEEDKTQAQEQQWGGTAGEPFDPNYHRPQDTIDNIDPTSQGIQGAGVGYVVGLYSQDQSGRNGMPIRDDRTRHEIAPS